MKNTKLFALILAGVTALALTACSNSHYTKEGGEITTSEITETAPDETLVETSAVEEAVPEADPVEETADNTITDREGNDITIPSEINTIISAAPSITEILTGLGLGDKIIAADIYSADVEGMNAELCTLDFYNLNTEELIALAPDVIIINGISQTGSDDPYKSLKDAGVNVVYIPSATSIEGIKLDIDFLAAYTGTTEKGAELIGSINNAVADVASRAADLTEKKKVYMEISAAPYMYTCGNGTYLNEIISLVGAENIYAGEEGWLSNSEETVIAADPDVILSTVSYDGYDFNEIKTRPGWEGIKAVANNQVFLVDANATSRPSQYVVDGIYEIARAVYPELYAE